MLVGKDFIFIHIPKTGGNFIREVIFRLRRQQVFVERLVGFLLSWAFFSNRQFKRLLSYRRVWVKGLRRRLPLNSQLPFHGGCVSIPGEHRDKLVLVATRDPVAFHRSCYHFQPDGDGVFNWRVSYKKAMYEKHDVAVVKAMPAPSFDQFVEFFNEDFPRRYFLRRTGQYLPSTIGFMTCLYILYLFKEPEDVLCMGDEELSAYFRGRRYRQDLPQVHFLRTEHLNQDLYDFLLSKGFSPGKLRFVLAYNKRNASEAGNYSDAPNPRLAAYIREKNQIYYEYFYRKGDSQPMSALLSSASASR